MHLDYERNIWLSLRLILRLYEYEFKTKEKKNCVFMINVWRFCEVIYKFVIVIVNLEKNVNSDNDVYSKYSVKIF